MSEHDRISTVELKALCDTLKSRLSQFETEMASTRAALQRAQGELDKRMRPAPEPMITDHALLRYLERIYKIDVNKARSEVMTPATIAAIKMGASAVTVNGVRFVIRENKIITTYQTEKETA